MDIEHVIYAKDVASKTNTNKSEWGMQLKRIKRKSLYRTN